jgi:hypothetical protein
MAGGKKFFGFAGFLLLFSMVSGMGCGGGSGNQIVNEDLVMQASDFDCIKNWEYVGPYYLTNKLGADNLAEALKVAKSTKGGTFPPGTVIQLIPLEAMVKRIEGFSPETNDWEFFALAVTGTATTIVTRGAAETTNFAGLKCLQCHAKAEPKWDFVCGDNHGCDPLLPTADQTTTDQMIKGFQDADPRCP